METEYLILNHSWEWKISEDFCEEFPYRFSSIFFKTFIIETVQSIYLPIFMISSQYSYSVSVLDLEDEDIQKGFNTMESSVDIIPHKEIVSILNQLIITGSFPQISNISSKSWNCPWMSPQTVTGALTKTMFDSSMSISLT